MDKLILNSKKLRLIKSFLLKILKIDEAKSDCEAKLLSSVLSQETLNGIQTAIREYDMERCCGAVTCEQCSFLKATSDNSQACEYIHPGCIMWH